VQVLVVIWTVNPSLKKLNKKLFNIEKVKGGDNKFEIEGGKLIRNGQTKRHALTRVNNQVLFSLNKTKETKETKENNDRHCIPKAKEDFIGNNSITVLNQGENVNHKVKVRSLTGDECEFKKESNASTNKPGSNHSDVCVQNYYCLDLKINGVGTKRFVFNECKSCNKIKLSNNDEIVQIYNSLGNKDKTNDEDIFNESIYKA